MANRKVKRRGVDWGSLLLTALLIAAVLFIIAGDRPQFYDEAQVLKLTGYEDYGIQGVGLSKVDRDYNSEFLALPAQVDGRPVAQIDGDQFFNRSVRHVLLPDCVVGLYGVLDSQKYVTLYSASAEVRDLCTRRGYQTGTAEEYYALLSAEQGAGLSRESMVETVRWSFLSLMGSWERMLILTVGLFAGMLICASIRKKSGRPNPLRPLVRNTFFNKIFLLTMLLACFISFYLVLCATEQAGYDTDSLVAELSNWPVKIGLVLLGIVLLRDLFYEGFFPWVFARIYTHVFMLLLFIAIGAGLGALGGALSEEFSFILHFVLAWPQISFYFLLALIASALFGPVLLPFLAGSGEKDEQPSAPSNPADSLNPFSSGDTGQKLIAPDGSVYPVIKVGLIYTVNGKELVNYNPHSSMDRPVDKYGDKYVRY